MNDLTKLPKWAQEHIRLLEAKLRHTEYQLQVIQFENTKCGSGSVKMTCGLNKEVVLNDHSIIEFKVNDSRIRVALRNEGDDYYIDINSDSHISISQRAAYSCYIR
jgi:hypothetical protein